jgi:carotenoid 9,10(9',10')-cleavage dioxygenase 1
MCSEAGAANNHVWLQIYDAKTMSPEPLATVQLPQRVPYGFHGMFVTQAQIDSQEALVKQ